MIHFLGNGKQQIVTIATSTGQWKNPHYFSTDPLTNHNKKAHPHGRAFSTK